MPRPMEPPSLLGQQREHDLADVARLRHVAECLSYVGNREHADGKRLEISVGEALHHVGKKRPNHLGALATHLYEVEGCVREVAPEWAQAQGRILMDVSGAELDEPP